MQTLPACGAVSWGVMVPWWLAIAAVGFMATQSGAGARQAEPAAGGISDPEAFFGGVRENLSRAQRVAHEFAYDERRTTVHTNPFGRLGTGGTELYRVYPSLRPELTYRRLLAREGVPVPDSELAEQDREYRARVAQVPSAASEDKNDTQRSRREREAAAARERAQATVEDVLGGLQFAIAGRSEFESSPAVLVSFAARPEVDPRTREGRLAQKFAGTIWIHPELQEVMHIEARSTDSIAFGFGIVARLSEGTTASVTRRPVESGLWMPTSVRLIGSGRALLFIRKLTVNYAIEWFNYKRGEEPPSAPD